MSGRRAAAASRRRAAGFTLLEIIVAFGILALGLTLLLGTLSGASRQLRDAGEAGRAALVAESLLATHAETLTGPGSWHGDAGAGRYRWRVEAEPWEDPARPRGNARVAPRAARLLRVRLDLQWGEGGPRQRLHLSTLRMALPRPEDAR